MATLLAGGFGPMGRAAAHPAVPEEILARLRQACAPLPEAYEEQAWVGTRWRVRKKTFAHTLVIASGWPPAYARAAGSDGPACVLTFRSELAAFDPQLFTEAPFFRPRWWPDIVGMLLDARTDWADVTNLLAGSYRALAPKKLVEALDGIVTPAARRRPGSR